MFGNNTNSNDVDKLVAENAHVFGKIEKRLEKHLELVSDNIGIEFGKVDRRYGRGRGRGDDNNDTKCRERFLKDFTEKEITMATLSTDVVDILKSSAEELLAIKKRVYTASGNNWNNFCIPRYMGIDIFGHVDRIGPAWRSRVKKELQVKIYANEFLGRKVFDVDKLVYISFFTGDLVAPNGRGKFDSFIGNINGSNFIVELDALVIRYMATLEEVEADNLLDTLCLTITDKVARLIITKKLAYKLAAEYVPSIFAEYGRTISPRDFFISMLINKVLCDGVNGVNSMNDESSMSGIVDLADLSIKNAGSVFNISKTARTIQGMLMRKSGRPKYLERFMDLIVEHVEHKKGDIVTSMNAHNKSFGLSISPEHINTHFTQRAAYIGTEEILIDDVENMRDIKIAFEEIEAGSLGLFSIFGMEDAGEKMEQYRKKTRAEVMAKLDTKERKRYVNLENEIIRYRSDAINCKDVSRKNILLFRSKGLGKIIAIEMGRPSNSEHMNLLLSMLEDSKYTTDGHLSARDFNRERNTKMYGQFVPSGDWDY